MNRGRRVDELVDQGQRHLWAHEWEAARDCHQEALDLVRRKKGTPAAWNLGVAATALGDWALARRAWRAFGVAVAGDSGPIDGDLGPTPVRLEGSDVVWGRRLCPARVRLEGVPRPGSGRRYGDVVLLAGTPDGTVDLAGREWNVFDELVLLDRSPYPTLTTTLTVTGPDDVDAAEERFVDAGFGFECWTAEVTGGRADVGIGAATPDDADRVLAAWQDAAPGRSHGAITSA